MIDELIRFFALNLPFYFFHFTNVSRAQIDKKMKKREMVLPRRISRLDKTPIVFITDVVGVKYVPNPES